MFMKFFLTEQLSLLARKQFPLALQAFRCRQPSQLPFLQSWLVVQANRLDLFSSMQSRIAGWLYKSDQESQQAPRRRNSKKLEAAWARMVQMTVRMLISVICQSAMDHLMNRNKYPAVASTQVTEKETKSKKTKGDGRIRRGIGRPLKRSTACATWRYTPSECQRDDDKLRQRGSKDQFWWTCLDCGSRWERVEWQADEEINRRSGARSSTENPATPTPIEIMTHSDNPYPQKLPPPKSRPELATLIVKDITAQSGMATPRPEQQLMLQGYASNATPDPLAAPTTPSWLRSPAELEEERPQGKMTSGRLPSGSRSQSAERRRHMSSGVRPMQSRTKPRTARVSERAEQFEIHSSENSEESIQVVSP